MKLQKEYYARMVHKLFYGVPLGHRNLFRAVWFGFCLCLGSGRLFVMSRLSLRRCIRRPSRFSLFVCLFVFTFKL